VITLGSVKASIKAIEAIIALITTVVTLITSWILGVRMRRRIRKAFGVEASNETELTSLKTWMAVENAEEKNRGGKLG
jgi:hypothetical protein